MSLIAEHISLNAEKALRLHDLSCEIRPGELTVIIGPNGSGKTSLIKILGGELKPSSGSVSLDDRDLHSWSAGALARRRAIMPQHATLDFPFRVRDVVALGRSPYPRDAITDRRLVEEAMACFDISEFADRMYTTLSGGERQRVHLARVWVQLSDADQNSPGYLLLDEPTSALDMRHQRELLALLETTVRAGKLGVIAALHDLSSAAQVADQLILLDSGRIVASGPREQVLTVEHIQTVYQVPVNFLRYTPGVSQMIAVPYDGTKNG